jgi:hypothetical protein
MARVRPRLGTMIVTALAAGVVSGCGQSPCMRVDSSNPLLARAMLLRVDVFRGDVTCAKTSLLSPQKSETLAPGQALDLDLAPGSYTVVLTSYLDAGGSTAIGRACSSVNLSGGGHSCLDLTLVAVDGGACSNGGSCACQQDTDCPTFEYCNLGTCAGGCKLDSESRLRVRRPRRRRGRSGRPVRPRAPRLRGVPRHHRLPRGDGVQRRRRLRDRLRPDSGTWLRERADVLRQPVRRHPQ